MSLVSQSDLGSPEVSHVLLVTYSSEAGPLLGPSESGHTDPCNSHFESALLHYVLFGTAVEASLETSTGTKCSSSLKSSD